MGFSKVILLGNLTRDPELRYTPQGTAVAEFGMAINRRFKDREDVSFVEVQCWEALAERATEILRKGQGAVITGTLKQDRWETKQGEKRSRLKVVAHEVATLSDQQASGSGGESPGPF